MKTFQVIDIEIASSLRLLAMTSLSKVIASPGSMEGRGNLKTKYESRKRRFPIRCPLYSEWSERAIK